MPGRSNARLALDLGRRRHHDDSVAAAFPAGLEQERYIEHDDRLAACLRLGQKLVRRRCDQRMHDGFKPGERASCHPEPSRKLCCGRPCRPRSSPERLARWRSPLHLRKVHARRRRNRAPARRASAKNFAVVDLPMPSEPVRQRMNGRSPLMTETSAPPQEIERCQQRQSQDREIVAFDPFEQLDAETFNLIGADTRRRRAADGVEIESRN